MDEEKTIRASIGTLGVLRLSQVKIEALPTTLYLMVGEKCTFNCLYCPQARRSNGSFENLSRVIWPKISWDAIKESLKSLPPDVGRVCFQVVNTKNYVERASMFIKDTKKIIKDFNLPLQISASVRTSRIEEVNELFASGLDRIGLPLDVASKEHFKEVRGGSFDAYLNTIILAASLFPGRVSTHLIVGLTESDFELYNLMKTLYENDIIVGLFAFTPVKGTPLQNEKPPKLSRFRRVQIMRYLLQKGVEFEPEFDKRGNLTFLKSSVNLNEIIKTPSIYQTSGCPSCNRPFYNESPRGPIYSYPYRIEVSEDIINEFTEYRNPKEISFKD